MNVLTVKLLCSALSFNSVSSLISVVAVHITDDLLNIVIYTYSLILINCVINHSLIIALQLLQIFNHYSLINDIGSANLFFA